MSGTLSRRLGSVFSIEFYSSPECHGSGHGEGKTLLGSTEVTTNFLGQANFDESFPTVVATRQITATASTGQVEGPATKEEES